MYQISSTAQRQLLHDAHGNVGGVYQLHCLKKDNSKTPIPICRVLGVDNNGILYIGKTASGLARIGDLTKSMSPIHSSSGHHVGIRFSKNPKLAEAFPFEDLYISFRPADDPATLERELITNYVMEFGEVPPLNANEP